jgi:hypothetical protein
VKKIVQGDFSALKAKLSEKNDSDSGDKQIFLEFKTPISFPFPQTSQTQPL